MEYQEYIKSELLILIPVLYIIGIGCKKSNLADKLIPLLLGGISVVLSAVWVISTSDISGIKEWLSAVFTSVTQGILIAGTSVYANQLYLQAKKSKIREGDLL